MNWCVSLKQKYAERILDGRKTIEIRTRLPRFLSKGDKIFVCTSGSCGQIHFSFRVRRKNFVDPEIAWKYYWDQMCISRVDYEKYIGGRSFVWLVEIEGLQVYNPPHNIKELNIKRPPMWFTLVTKEV